MTPDSPSCPGPEPRTDVFCWSQVPLRQAWEANQPGVGGYWHVTEILSPYSTQMHRLQIICKKPQTSPQWGNMESSLSCFQHVCPHQVPVLTGSLSSPGPCPHGLPPLANPQASVAPHPLSPLLQSLGGGRYYCQSAPLISNRLPTRPAILPLRRNRVYPQAKFK